MKGSQCDLFIIIAIVVAAVVSGNPEPAGHRVKYFLLLMKDDHRKLLDNPDGLIHNKQ
ncbi:hypothetical protein GCM10009414_29600 [Tatumella terrea]|uniref:hypothetical protein n=1 Tax=Tatumella terrea TaxID=419007 RepID=UPI0031CEEAB5